MKLALRIMIIGVLLNNLACGTDEQSEPKSTIEPTDGLYVIQTSDISIECSDGSTGTRNSELERLEVVFGENGALKVEGNVIYEGTYTDTAFDISTSVMYGTDDIGDYKIYREMQGTIFNSVLTGEIIIQQIYSPNTWCEFQATFTMEPL